jgi:hypothetical protein
MIVDRKFLSLRGARLLSFGKRIHQNMVRKQHPNLPPELGKRITDAIATLAAALEPSVVIRKDRAQRIAAAEAVLRNCISDAADLIESIAETRYEVQVTGFSARTKPNQTA